ncbi:MAG: hypothetical protein GTO02_22115 [Candidatus Dadabacteria bacterium]|nr:hypothetical protein [Candidatus Dadabacteria bacterium]NIQ16978.1 hypothetical protein [Candidatus Dadabacteria bacterium]
MGLIDNVRKRRDPWEQRFEEHRFEPEEYDHEFEKLNAEKIEEQVKLNCSKVGKFDHIEK